MDQKTQKAVHRPDFEALLRMGEREIAVIAFFQDGYGGFDVVVGLEDSDQRLLISATLRQCASAVEEAQFIIFPSDAPAADDPAW